MLTGNVWQPDRLRLFRLEQRGCAVGPIVRIEFTPPRKEDMRRITLTIGSLVAALALAAPSHAYDRSQLECEDCEGLDLRSAITGFMRSPDRTLAELEELLGRELDDDDVQALLKALITSARTQAVNRRALAPRSARSPQALNGPPAPSGERLAR
jgi:hypothetical protein